MPRLSATEAEQRLKSVRGWRLEGDQITKQFTFRDFPEAVGFVNALVHARDAYAVMPTGLVLSLLVLMLVGAATWSAFAGLRSGEQP